MAEIHSTYVPTWWALRDDGSANVPDSLSHLRSRLNALGDVLSAVRVSDLEHGTTHNLGLILQDYAHQIEAFEDRVQRTG